MSPKGGARSTCISLLASIRKELLVTGLRVAVLKGELSSQLNRQFLSDAVHCKQKEKITNVSIRLLLFSSINGQGYGIY